MISIRILLLIIFIFYTSNLDLSASHIVRNPNSNSGNNQLSFGQYMDKFNKSYASAADRRYAEYYYNYNVRLINRHNSYYDRGLRTFNLTANQFTDMRLVNFRAIFKEVIQPTASLGVAPPPVQEAPIDYDPRNLGFNYTVQNQGTKCNSGWAYASAKAIEMMQAFQLDQRSPEPLSAQNIIDCAGRSTGCTNQIPHTAFEYLATYQQDLYFEKDYENKPNASEQGMCVPKQTEEDTVVTNLDQFSTLADGDDKELMQYVADGFPVVVEYNPTSFEFMHYSHGVFQQPATRRGSHFMTVIGYGRDEKLSLDYWLLQNSFGEDWGEKGLIRIHRNQATPLTKTAVFPIELAA